MGKNLKFFTDGLIKNNPTFVLVLGMCPTLATTTSAANGLGMGVATLFVLVMSNIVISLLKNVIPDKVRIPAYIVVISSFVTVVQLLMQAYVQELYNTLGVFIPLMRNHSAWGTRQQELWRFSYKEKMAKVVNIRYALIPYLYSEFMKCALRDECMYRPHFRNSKPHRQGR